MVDKNLFQPDHQNMIPSRFPVQAIESGLEFGARKSQRTTLLGSIESLSEELGQWTNKCVYQVSIEVFLPVTEFLKMC